MPREAAHGLARVPVLPQLGWGCVNTDLQGLVWPPEPGAACSEVEGSRVSAAGQEWKDLRGELRDFPLWEM